MFETGWGGNVYFFDFGHSSIEINDIRFEDICNILCFVPNDMKDITIRFGALGSFERDIHVVFWNIPSKDQLWILECSDSLLLSDLSGGIASQSYNNNKMPGSRVEALSKCTYHHTTGSIHNLYVYYYYKNDGTHQCVYEVP
jgi:hypothetical protein